MDGELILFGLKSSLYSWDLTHIIWTPTANHCQWGDCLHTILPLTYRSLLDFLLAVCDGIYFGRTNRSLSSAIFFWINKNVKHLTKCNLLIIAWENLFSTSNMLIWSQKDRLCCWRDILDHHRRKSSSENTWNRHKSQQ